MSGWRVSSFCGDGACVEVSAAAGRVAVRSSRPEQAGVVLVFTADEWDAFLAGVVRGEFDVETLRGDRDVR